MAYYRFIMPFGLAKFKRYALSVWNVDPTAKSDEEIAKEGLDRMEAYMKRLDLVMNIKDLGVSESMINEIANNSFVNEGGYKVLSYEEIVQILKESTGD